MLFAKLRKATISIVVSALSVCPHETPLLPLDGFSQNVILNSFRKSAGKKNLASLKSRDYKENLI